MSTDGIIDDGDNEEIASHPSEVDEEVEGGRALEDSPVIPGGATDATTKNISDADDEPDGES